MTQNGLKIYLYQLDIEKLWRISELRNIFYLVKDLIFKLNHKVKFFVRSGKMSWNSKSKAHFVNKEEDSCLLKAKVWKGNEAFQALICEKYMLLTTMAL